MCCAGQKLGEQLYNLGRKPFLALALLATADPSEMPPLWGSWAGNRVVQIGDYSDDTPDFLNEEEVATIKECGSVWNMADGKHDATDQ